jgi:enamine deaminase RidA (YjgF/YER057c/UK114 family)
MPALHVLQPPDWAAPKGYANGIAVDLQPGMRLLFIGGQIGWNGQQQFESDDFIDQCRQALANVRAVLESGGSGPAGMARMTWYVTRRDEYNRRLRELGTVYREVMGKHFPAMTCVEVSALMEARAQVEIEVTAVALPTP